VLDFQAGQLLLNVAAQYKADSEGRIIDIRPKPRRSSTSIAAGRLACISRAERTWGEAHPSRTAQLVPWRCLFHVECPALQMGFCVGYEKSWTFGPLRVRLSPGSTLMPGELETTPLLRPAKFYGGFELTAFGFGISIELDARIEAQTPTPRQIEAEFDVKIKLPWPYPTLGPGGSTCGVKTRQYAGGSALGAVSCELLKATEKWPSTGCRITTLAAPILASGMKSHQSRWTKPRPWPALTTRMPLTFWARRWCRWTFGR